MISLIKTYFYGMMDILTKTKQVIPSAFFKLSTLGKLQIAIVYNGADFIIIALSIIGFIISLTKLSTAAQKALSFLRLYFLSLLVLLILQVVFNFGELEYTRIIYLMSIV